MASILPTTESKEGRDQNVCICQYTYAPIKLYVRLSYYILLLTETELDLLLVNQMGGGLTKSSGQGEYDGNQNNVCCQPPFTHSVGTTILDNAKVCAL